MKIVSNFAMIAVTLCSIGALAQRPLPGYPGGSPGGGQPSNNNRALVSDARAHLSNASQSLNNADSQLGSSFESAYQQAMADVCEGHCSPGITSLLQQMHSAVDSARSGIQSAASSGAAVDNDLQGIQ